MSLFSWFTRKPIPAKSRKAAPPGPLSTGAAVPRVSGGPGQAPAVAAPPEPSANRKNQRMKRREFLYAVVRDAMVRAGVLSASYKFKVLSLDQGGHQFLVMVDLAHECGSDTARLSEIEALIAQSAKTRYDIVVTAVYWRVNDHVAVGMVQKGAAPHGTSLPAMPPSVAVQRLAVDLTVHAAAPAGSTVLPVVPAAQRVAPRFDPIEADEVAAFKRALVTATAARQANAAPGVQVHSGPLRPPAGSNDFADTELFAQGAPAQDLSTTQYGDL